MAAGSIFLAPLADKIGRRLLILVCLVIAGLSMLGCALSAKSRHVGSTSVYYRNWGRRDSCE